MTGKNLADNMNASIMIINRKKIPLSPSPSNRKEVKNSRVVLSALPKQTAKLYKQIQQTYSKLKGQVKTLENNIDLQMEKQQSQFLIAYENHMKEVLQELESLKNACSPETAKKTKEDYIEKLKEAIEWFKHEALRLSKIKQANADELKKWEKYLDQIEEEKLFLQSQLNKALKKNSNINISDEDLLSRVISNPPNLFLTQLPKTENKKASFNNNNDNNNEDKMNPDNIETFLNELKRKNLPNEEFIEKVDEFFYNFHKSKEDEIEKLKLEYETEKEKSDLKKKENCGYFIKSK